MKFPYLSISLIGFNSSYLEIITKLSIVVFRYRDSIPINCFVHWVTVVSCPHTILLLLVVICLFQLGLVHWVTVVSGPHTILLLLVVTYVTV